MIAKLVPYPHTGSSSTNLVGQRTFDERFKPSSPSVGEQFPTGAPASDRDRYTEGVRDAKERLHGEAIVALTVGMLAGTISGVMYRELGRALAGALGY